jgi:hypothetical protein
MSASSHDPPDGEASTSEGVSRRRFLQVAGGAVGAAAVGAGAYEAVSQSGGGRSLLPSMPVRSSGPVQTFHSRPDLRPPGISVPSPQNFDGDYLFLGPWALGATQPGPLMVDHGAEPVWFRPVSSGARPSSQLATNLRPFTYRGEPVLAWWEGQVLKNGFGQGEAVIVDRSYREVARVRAAGGRQMDLHEFQLTPQGTALFTCYPETVPADLRSIGGPRHGSVQNSIFQEVDVPTGRLLTEWRSLDHIPVSECMAPAVSLLGYHQLPYFHLNSIAFTPDGNLLISGRHTWALYKLDRRSGQVIWRLGGKRSNFQIDPAAQFSWQHDARQPTAGTITVFDNRSSGGTSHVLRYSRGLVMKLDEAGRRVSLAQAINHPLPLLSITMGSVQVRPNGNVVVGWGTEGYVSEFTPSDRLQSDARLLLASYRVLLLPWRGTPQRPPDLTVGSAASTGKPILYASWNGDTETAYWAVHAGGSPSSIHPIGIARRRGFETAIPVGGVSGYVAVTGLDEHLRPLGHSSTVRL